VTLLAAGPFVFYLAMRSSLDAVAVRSYNTRSNIAGLATFGAIAAAGLLTDVVEPAFAVAWAFAGGVLVQGAMTFVFVQRRFAVPVADYALLPALALAAVTGAIALAVRPLVESAAPLLLLAVAEIALAALFFGGLAVAGVRWTRALREGSLGRGG
jgi:hypothetical protein